LELGTAIILPIIALTVPVLSGLAILAIFALVGRRFINRFSVSAE
jgi:hypothetical protein